MGRFYKIFKVKSTRGGWILFQTKWWGGQDKSGEKKMKENLQNACNWEQERTEKQSLSWGAERRSV